MKWVITFLVCCLAFSCASPSDEEVFPQSQGFLNDFAGKLSPADKRAIEAHLRGVNSSGAVQMAVVIVPQLNGYDVADYTVRLAKKWGVGKKEKDNGVMFLIAVAERKTRLEIGYGLEPKIPDSVGKAILDDVARPKLKAGDYAGGITAVIDAVVQRVAQKEGK